MNYLAAQELQSFVRRIESLDDEIRALNADKSEVFKEVKGAGFTAKTLRKVVAARRMDATERDEADTEFELYWNAVHGIELDPVRAHVENIEEFPQVASDQHVEANTEIGLAGPADTCDGEAANIKPAPNAGSSNGRTADFDSANAGSTPAPASI